MADAECRQNRLLAAMTDADRARLSLDLKLVPLELSQVLYDSGRLDHVYFPITAIVSLLHRMRDGLGAEVAIVGNDGFVGVSQLLGGDAMPGKAVVLRSGSAFQLPSYRLREEFAREPSVREILLRYTQALMTQVAQTVVCNRHHTLEQQLSRWLLLSMDLMPAADLAITQESIANLLGVRRERITEAAGKLRDAGLIRYRRRHIFITDRAGLESRACECYSVVRSEVDRILPPCDREPDGSDAA